MATDSATATLDAPELDQDQTDWGAMSAAEKKADIDKAVKEIDARDADTSDAGGLDDTPPPAATETPSDDDVTPAAADSAPAATPEAGDEDDRAWLDAETKDLAAAYGITDEDLADVGSREELDRAMRIIDRKAFEAGKAAAVPQADAKPVVQQSEAPKPTAPTGDPWADLKQFMLSDEIDADAREPINKFVQTVAAEMKELRAMKAAMQQQQMEASFNDLRTKAVTSIHSLGHTDLFGKPGEAPTKEQAANLEKALDAHFTHARGLIATGRQAAPTPAFLKAAVNLLFGDQLVSQAKKQHLAALKKQSARRSGGGTTKAVPQSIPDNETTRQAARRIASDPEVQEAWKRSTGQE